MLTVSHCSPATERLTARPAAAQRSTDSGSRYWSVGALTPLAADAVTAQAGKSGGNRRLGNGASRECSDGPASALAGKDHGR
jgi:hypothetical protein